MRGGVNLGDSFLSYQELEIMASSKREYERLEAQRSEYFQELYEDVRYFAYRYTDYSDSAGPSPRVEDQALGIIDAKEAYDLRILKIKDRYARWLTFLQLIDREAADLLKKRFELQEPMLETKIEKAVKRSIKEWESLEEGRGKALDEEAYDHLVYMRERFPDLFKTRKKNNKKQYTINGRFVYMLPEEYEVYKKAEKERLDAVFETHGKLKANESLNAL